MERPWDTRLCRKKTKEINIRQSEIDEINLVF